MAAELFRPYKKHLLQLQPLLPVSRSTPSSLYTSRPFLFLSVLSFTQLFSEQSSEQVLLRDTAERRRRLSVH